MKVLSCRHFHGLLLEPVSGAVVASCCADPAVIVVCGALVEPVMVCCALVVVD